MSESLCGAKMAIFCLRHNPKKIDWNPNKFLIGINKMGRYYTGNISGKFWFGVQDSSMLERYGGTLTENYCWLGCCCLAEEGDTYCHHCYESEEDHKKDVEENGEELETMFDDLLCEITRETFNEVVVPWLNKHNELGNYIHNISYEGDQYEQTVLHDDIPTDKLSDFADYLILKQIEHFFEKEEDDCCSFNAEC
jgi:hypothetical protein